MLEAKAENETDSPQEIVTREEKAESKDCKAEHYRIILEMSRVDEDESRLKEECEKKGMLCVR